MLWLPKISGASIYTFFLTNSAKKDLVSLWTTVLYDMIIKEVTIVCVIAFGDTIKALFCSLVPKDTYRHCIRYILIYIYCAYCVVFLSVVCTLLHIFIRTRYSLRSASIVYNAQCTVHASEYTTQYALYSTHYTV